jgi:transcription elongation GreA/GreB family factor
MGAQPADAERVRLAAADPPVNVEAMSRAFVKEDDDAPEEIPERPVSSAPNLVTPEGLAAIEAEIARLTEGLAEAAEDRDARARIARDLRYWTARRSSAHLVTPSADSDVVHFGSTVTIDREDGRRQTFRIVGEDEAEPENGTLSYIAPLARALMGKGVGDVVNVAGGEAEIAEIR